MAGAHEQPPSLGDRKKLLGLPHGVDERFLDVHMCSGLECFPSRFEVRARGSADVYDVRFGRAQQFCQGRIAGGVGQRRQLMAGRIVLVVNAYDAVWRGHPAEGVKVEPSHVPGPNKCDAKRLHGWR